MNIFLAADNNMLAPLSACLHSIALSNKQNNPHVFVAHGKISLDEYERLAKYCEDLGITHTLIAVDPEQFDALMMNMKQGHVSGASLYRCKIGSLLPASVAKAIYIDCDTVVLASLQDLFDFQLGKATVAAVVTPMSHLMKHGVPEHSYFNTGVMLIDLQKWRRDNIEDAVFRILREMPQELEWWDQCAINIALSGRARPLDRKFNHIFSQNQLGPGFELPVILHFAGATKPWHAPLTHPWGGIFLELSAATPWPVSPTQGQNKTMELLKNYAFRIARRLKLRG